MLYIYTGKNKPENMKLVYDNEAYFPRVEVKDTEINREVIQTIDKGTYKDTTNFYDLNNNKIYLTLLSTGAKTLLNILNSECLVNGIELGQNAFELLIAKVNGSVYFDSTSDLEMPEWVDFTRLCINGKIPKSFMEMEDLFYEY